MSALAALVLLASSTVRIEDLHAPGTLICTCTPATVPAEAAAESTEVPDAPPRLSRWGFAAGASALALFGGSLAARLHSEHLQTAPLGRSTTLGLDAGHWNAASTVMLVGGAALAGFSAAFFLVRF